MFGTNELESRVDHQSGTSLDVVDVFPTIQGEGPHAGLAATFVRLAGCHLRCYFCDTDFTSNRRLLPIEDIARMCEGARLVVLTGGEPFRQSITPLITLLELQGVGHVQIETAGTFWPANVRESLDFEYLLEGGFVSIVVSPKTGVIHSLVEQWADAYKYIITSLDDVDEADGLPIMSTQQRGRVQRLARPPARLARSRVYVQPCHVPDDPQATERATRACVELSRKYGYRLSLQQHKLLGLP